MQALRPLLHISWIEMKIKSLVLQKAEIVSCPLEEINKAKLSHFGRISRNDRSCLKKAQFQVNEEEENQEDVWRTILDREQV